MTTHTTSNQKRSYPTDEFGRPDGRNYQYRISLDDGRALRKASIADKFMGRWVEWDSTGDNVPFGCVHIRTHDNKGHIPGLATCVHSHAWEDMPTGPGRLEGLEMRQSTSRGGGTKIKGSVYAGATIYGAQFNYLHITTAVEATPGQIRKAYNGDLATDDADDVRDQIEDAVHWAIQDRMDELHEELAPYVADDGYVDFDAYEREEGD